MRKWASGRVEWAGRRWWPSGGASDAIITRSAGVGLVALLVALADSPAQLSVRAVPMVTRASPTAGGRSLTEGYLAHPTIMGSTRRHGVSLSTMLNLEGLTLQRGELSAGAYGEGYFDRRHPHSYLHEVMAEVTRVWSDGAGASASLAVGRGFVPFGSDDPMARPLIRYPVNHHHAQILERLVAIAALRAGPLVLEGATFNGDEPHSPESVPRFSRFGDSWAARLSWFAVPGVELSGSFASVRSPEEPSGHGLHHRKASAVARYAAATPRGSRYALAEWARTSEWREDFNAPYTSTLAEVAECVRGATLALRFERTDRPEESRGADLFRTPRPAHDLGTLGTTRWTIGTVSVAWRAPRGRAAVRPFMEMSAAQPRTLEPRSLFVPRDFYGATTLWTASAGATIAVGHTHDRMGRYGVARFTAMSGTSTMGHDHSPAAVGTTRPC